MMDKILADIQAWKEGKYIYTWKWSREDTVRYITHLENKELESLDEGTLGVIREAADELCEMEEPHVLETIGWFYYGGNRLYPCDWVRSRDIFLKLLDMESVEEQKKCVYANTLGYIFYYGRCNQGIPEYEKALKYFSIGAAGWIYESIYKLSDMYLHGYGTPVNRLAAANYIHFIYRENLKYIQEGHFDGKFADVALRMGNLCRDGAVTGNAYYYYTLADYVIRKRIPYEHFGDAKVFTGIQMELNRIREEKPLSRQKVFRTSGLHWIRVALEEHTCKIEFKQVKDGIRITAKRLAKPNTCRVRKFFLCIPECGYCELTDKVSETALNVRDFRTFNGGSKVIADEIDVKWKKGRQYYIFLHHGEQTAVIEADGFRFGLPSERRDRRHRAGASSG